jgi:hypothetical protein
MSTHLSKDCSSLRLSPLPMAVAAALRATPPISTPPLSRPPGHWTLKPTPNQTSSQRHDTVHIAIYKLANSLWT